MLRRCTVSRNMWAKYRFSHAAVPKAEGPPPLDAPQNMNRGKKTPFLDPIDDPFPRSIRGDTAQPDVPDANYVQQWYFLYTTTSASGELFPWTSTAPEGAYRFRPHNEFNALGRERVQRLRETDRLRLPDGSFRNAQRGAQGLPDREEFLTLMNSTTVNGTSAQANAAQTKNQSSAAASPSSRQNTPTPCTIMDRARKERYQRVRHLSPMQQQLDVGRTERVPVVAANIPVDKAAFPYNWKTEDWYEYEIAKVRMQRFNFENAPTGAAPFASEVTYKIVLSMAWEHHMNPFADDVAAFLREVGRQAVEEKLVSLRNTLLSVRGGNIDPELRAAYALDASAGYSDDEIRMQQQRELEQLEAECVHTLSLMNASASDLTNKADRNSSWPVIETLEPWRRMVEFWGERGDSTFANAEMSTRKYEFRRFFRVIRVKMPFQSTEFEKRMYDVRHWAHRGATIEFQTIHKKNLVHDAGVFPVERDPVEATTHEHHRMFSFALDWQSAPANFLAETQVHGADGETAQAVADRLGCSLASLRAANPALSPLLGGAGAGSALLPAGTVVVVPADATKRLTSTSVSAKRIALAALPDQQGKSWAGVAAALRCTVDELKAANGEALATYKDEADAFDASTESLHIPSTLLAPAVVDGFSDVEPTFVGDTFDAIAARLGTTVADLRAANGDVADPRTVTHVKVPASALRPRRRTDPLQRTAESVHELFPKMRGEIGSGQIPAAIPHEPANAANFPGEYADGAGAYPVNPRQLPATDDWLSYTATYLDRELSLAAPAVPLYNTNRVWPAQAIPGSLQQEPFEEDQTWLLHRFPLQTHEVSHPDTDIAGTYENNTEQYAQSMDWRAP